MATLTRDAAAAALATPDSEAQVLRQREEAAQLSQADRRSAGNGWLTTGPLCWLCARWREVRFQVGPHDVKLPAEYADNRRLQDTTDYMFRMYLCCEADGWKPVRMNRVPGEGFDIYRVLPRHPGGDGAGDGDDDGNSDGDGEGEGDGGGDAATAAVTGPGGRSGGGALGNHHGHDHHHHRLGHTPPQQHLLQRYFYMVHIVRFAKAFDLGEDGSGGGGGGGGGGNNLLMCFCKSGSVGHLVSGAQAPVGDGEPKDNTAQEPPIPAYPFPASERNMFQSVTLEFAQAGGRVKREVASFPDFFHLFPVRDSYAADNEAVSMGSGRRRTAQQEKAKEWWGKDLVDEAYDDSDLGREREVGLTATPRQLVNETNVTAWNLFFRADCHLSDAFAADWEHSKIGELLRARVKLLEASGGAVPSLVGGAKGALPLKRAAAGGRSSSAMDIRQTIAEVQSSLRAKFNDLQNIFRYYLTVNGDSMFLLTLRDFLIFCQDTLLLHGPVDGLDGGGDDGFDGEVGAGAAGVGGAKSQNPLRRGLNRLNRHGSTQQQQQQQQQQKKQQQQQQQQQQRAARRRASDLGAPPPSVALGRDTLERLFFATNITPDKRQEAHRNNNDSLTRYEFMELVVRCAIEVGSKSLAERVKELRAAGMLLNGEDNSVAMPTIPSVATMLEQFWDEYVAPRAKFEDPQWFRSTLMYNEGIHRILARKETALRATFAKFATSRHGDSGGGGKPFTFWTDAMYIEFCKQLKRHNIIDVSTSTLRKVFLRTSPLAEDEVATDRQRQLSFNEWLETLCRLCHAQAQFEAANSVDAGPGQLCEKTFEPFVEVIVDHANVFHGIR